MDFMLRFCYAFTQNPALALKYVLLCSNYSLVLRCCFVALTDFLRLSFSCFSHAASVHERNQKTTLHKPISSAEERMFTEAAWAWDEELKLKCRKSVQVKASAQFEHKLRESKHKLFEYKCRVLSESITTFEREINKSCSQTVRPHSWIENKNKRPGTILRLLFKKNNSHSKMTGALNEAS